MHRSRFLFTLALVLMLAASVSMTSCGTGGAGGTNPDLVLLGFNVPNLSGIPLNQPLIFTFSASINPSTITPDSLRVVGLAGPTFESTIVDGNLVALLPEVPNFANYSDAGYAPNTVYTVSLTEFPAVTTIESTTGKPLLQADSFTFRTLPAPSPDIVSNIRCSGADGILGTADDTTPSSASFFIEPRRAIRHGTPPSLLGTSDDDGCLQNSANDLYQDPISFPGAIQAGSGPGARLLCLQNEGSPRVIEALSTPRHNTPAFGSASAAAPGLIDLPAIRVRLNEPLDPATIEAANGALYANVQLWRIALKNGDPLPGGPQQRLTNKPIVVQDVETSELILVPTGPVSQGIYCVNITPSVKDLPGCPLRTNDAVSSAIGGFAAYEPSMAGVVPPGYRIYFRTLVVPDTALSIIEQFSNNIGEYGDNQSAGAEIGVHTHTDLNGDVTDGTEDGRPQQPNIADLGEQTTVFTPLAPLDVTGAQSTTAQWNGSGTNLPGAPIASVNGYRFLNIPTLTVGGNPSGTPEGRLQHVRTPYTGIATDVLVSNGTGAFIGLDTDIGDGVFEYDTFDLKATDTLTVTGTRPLLILCKGDFTVSGTILMNGEAGGPGFDTDGTPEYNATTNPGALSSAGEGGIPGPGGGAGGIGADPLGTNPLAHPTQGQNGGLALTLFGDDASTAFAPAVPTAGLGGQGFDDSAAGTNGSNEGSLGGSGGGFAATGSDGQGAAGLLGPVTTGGPVFGSARFSRAISLFQPDRGHQPNANITGGMGGGGGGIDDDLNASEVGDAAGGPGDDGGAGGGGGGGGLWVICGGTVTINGTAVIEANGGRGGNTYARAQQKFDDGPDNDPGGTDNVFAGLAGTTLPTDPGTGQGGPGGGGSGGAIFIVGKGGLTVAAGAMLSATGGAGGTSDDIDRIGGAGSVGRITLLTFESSGATVPVMNGTSTPAAVVNAVAADGWKPTVEDFSVGQSNWVDLVTNNVVYAPDVDGGGPLPPEFPTFNANFTLDVTPGKEGYLETSTAAFGGGQTPGFPGGTFDAQFEFQGADLVSPPGAQWTADGLTNWVAAPDIAMLNGKRWLRWRWRFWTAPTWGTNPGDPANLQVPTVFDVTIPFLKP